MADPIAAFVGSIPVNYDRYLGPLFFDQYAEDLAARVPVADGLRVLEVACGTGIVTRRLVARLAGRRARVVATDLNEAMFAHARTRLPGPDDATYRTADGTSLPFESGSFDVVVCQFGIMFMDKAAAMAEVLRVLRPGGAYLLNTWDSLEQNVTPRLAHETVARFFPQDPPKFYTVPFSYHDPAAIEAHLAQAGFDSIRVERVAKEGTSPSAADAATGLIEGNPVYGEIMSRRPQALAEIKAAVAAALAREFGTGPLRVPLRAVVATARKPGG
jgi:ubiquinone/menaquinone biosynthesis C-methylase UbiE